MSKPFFTALTIALAVTTPAAAQLPKFDWGASVRISPFIGISPSFLQVGEATIAANGGAIVQDYEMEFNSGVGLGLAAEVRLWDAFTLIGSGMWSSRGDGDLNIGPEGQVYEFDGTDFWLFKAGVALRLHEGYDDMQLNRAEAAVFIAPALLIDNPKTEPTTPASARGSNSHPAISFGAEGQLPFWDDRMAFVAAVEDYLVFWDNSATLDRVAGALQSSFAGSTIAVEANRSHMWFFRLGVEYRF